MAHGACLIVVKAQARRPWALTLERSVRLMGMSAYRWVSCGKSCNFQLLGNPGGERMGSCRGKLCSQAPIRCRDYR